MDIAMRGGACPVGIGLRAPHHAAFAAGLGPEHAGRQPDWLEVHSENFFAEGGAAPALLDRLAADWPLSLHGVGLGLGSARGYDRAHLQRLARLVRRVRPALVSEHLCWGAVPGRHLNDLLPLPLDRATLALMVDRVSEAQDALGREIAIENVSALLRAAGDDYDESGFLVELARRSGCRLLVDINNYVVNRINLGIDPRAALAAIPAELVAEVHLAGHSLVGDLAIDDHGSAVGAEALALYREFIARIGPVPTLIERDTCIPSLAELLDEAAEVRALATRTLAATSAPAMPAGDPSGTHRRVTTQIPPGAAPDTSRGAARDAARQAAADAAHAPRATGRAATRPPRIDTADWQQAFAQAILDRDATTDFLPQCSASEAGVPAPAAGADLAHRVALYRGSLAAHASAALRGAHPAVARVLGDTNLDALGRVLVRLHPSRSGNLDAWGEALAGFIETHPAFAERRWLADLARLDWALHCAWSAPDAPLLTLAELATADPDAVTDAHFAPHPAARRLVLDAGIHALHERLIAGEVAGDDARPEPPATGPDTAVATPRATGTEPPADAAPAPREVVLVGRVGLRAEARVLDTPTAALLRQLDAGRSLGDAAEAAGLDAGLLMQALAAGITAGAWISLLPPDESLRNESRSHALVTD